MTMEVESTPPVEQTEAQAIIDAAQEAVSAQKLELGAVYSVIGPDGHREIIDTNMFQRVPRDYRDKVWFLDDVDSFIDFVAAHDEGDTEIWADLSDNRREVSVIAYLDANGHGLRRVHLSFDRTARWVEWLKRDRNFYGQEEFAEFLEDHTEDLLTPDAATMLEVAQSLRATIKTDFQSGKRLDSGQAQLVYKEEIEGSAGKAGTLTIPEEIEIGLQPYTTSDVFKIKAKFRYRIHSGNLRVGIKLMNTDKVLEHLFATVVEKLRDADVAPVYIGVY